MQYLILKSGSRGDIFVIWGWIWGNIQSRHSIKIAHTLRVFTYKKAVHGRSFVRSFFLHTLCSFFCLFVCLVFVLYLLNINVFVLSSEIIPGTSCWSHVCRLCVSLLGQVEVSGMLYHNPALFKKQKKNATKF